MVALLAVTVLDSYIMVDIFDDPLILVQHSTVP